MTALEGWLERLSEPQVLVSYTDANGVLQPHPMADGDTAQVDCPGGLMTTAEREIQEIECTAWEEPLYMPFRYKVLYGGRSSGKTWAVARALVLQSYMEKHVIYCVREHQKSLDLSAKPALDGWIDRLRVASLVQDHP